MLREVVVAAVRDAFELLPADRVEVLDVARRAGVVRALRLVVLAHAKVDLAQTEVAVPGEPLLEPVLEPLRRLGGRDEELHLHLLELADAEEEVARRDLVPERLADLGDAERRLAAGELGDVLEVDEDALRRLGAEVRGGALVLERADVRLEHEVELARLGEVAVGRLAGTLARLAAAARDLELVGAEAELARTAVDERVGEAGDVARRLPDARVEDDRGVEGDDVVALLHHRAEPERADVVLREDAVVAVVVRRAEPAVDLGGREDEAATAAEGDDRVHRHRLRRLGHGRRLPGRFGGNVGTRSPTPAPNWRRRTSWPPRGWVGVWDGTERQRRPGYADRRCRTRRSSSTSSPTPPARPRRASSRRSRRSSRSRSSSRSATRASSRRTTSSSR